MPAGVAAIIRLICAPGSRNFPFSMFLHRNGQNLGYETQFLLTSLSSVPRPHTSRFLCTMTPLEGVISLCHLPKCMDLTHVCFKDHAESENDGSRIWGAVAKI